MPLGARTIAALTEQDKVLIAGCCTHAPLEEDIGRVKLPRLLRKKAGEGLRVDIYFPPLFLTYA